MAKLSAETTARLKALGINAKTEDDAREKMLEILEENDLSGMEGEDTDMLLDLVESVQEPVADTDDDEEPAPAPKKKAKPVVVEDDDDEDEEPAPKKKAAPAPEPAPVKKKKPVVADDDDDDDEVQAPKKKAKPVVEDDDDDDEPAAPAPKKKAVVETKPAKKAAVKKETVKRGRKLNPRDNEDDAAIFTKMLGKIFPEKDYIYAWVSTAGVTIKLKGKNTNRALILIENATERDGGIFFNLFFLTFGKKKELLEEAGIDFETSWNNVPFIKGVELKEGLELIKQFEKEMKDSVIVIDKKLGENRQKMEENLKSDKKTAAAAPAKKKVVVDDDDDDEDEEPVAPVKKKKPVVADDDDDDDEVQAPKKKAKK